MQTYKKDIRVYLAFSFVLFLIFYIIGNWAFSVPGEDIFMKISYMTSNEGIGALLNHPFYYFMKFHLLSLAVGGIAFMCGLMAYIYRNDKGVYRNEEEHGSARFATADELSKFADENPDNNMIFTKNASMGLFNKNLPFNYQKNKNVLVVGGPGSGKTYTFVKPNLMQMNASFVITDPKGLLIHETGKMLEDNGYKIKIFDLNTLYNSDTFNVFNYIKTELDIDRVLEAITEGTKKSDKADDDFWPKAEALLIRSFIAYLWFDGRDNDYIPHLGMIADMLRNTERIDPKVPSPVEEWFEELGERHPNNYACRQWELFNNLYKAETRMSVLGIAAARYSVFDHDQVTDMIRKDTMDIESWTDEKTAVFIAIPETSGAYNFLASIFLSTVMEVLRTKIDQVLKGQRKVSSPLLHVRFILDEFANIGRIPNIDRALASFRSREMSIVPILQSLDQLKTMYKNGWGTFVDVCDSFLFLGGNEKETTSYLSQRADKQTISIRNQSISNGNRNGGSENRQKQARDLLTPGEVGRLKEGNALLFINGLNVFKDKKFTVQDHKNAHLLANEPGDNNWYYYKRYRNEEERILDEVMPEDLIDHGMIDEYGHVG